jgi:four helix bundle protein
MENLIFIKHPHLFNMATIHKFDDLDVWKKARELENQVFELTKNDKFSKDYGLKDQINRASGSIMDNIAEGFGRGSNTEFINFLIISRGSAAEVQSQLHRALDRNYIDSETFLNIYKKGDLTSASLTNFINYLKTKKSNDIRKP